MGMARRRHAITERVPTTPRKVVVYTDNLMTSNSARNITASESGKELADSLGDTLNTALVISTSFRFDPELNMLEILDPYNPRNNIQVKGITNYQVSVKLFILSAATDARNRPSPLYVKQALTCIKKQLGSVTIDELFVSFADISAPPAATSNYDNISLLPQKPKRLVYERRHVQQTSNGELESNGEEESSGEQETNTDLASTGEHSPNSENPPNGEQCSSSPGEIGNGSSNETDESDMLRYHKVWRMVNRLKADGDATKIGICDVSKQQLAQLCEHSGAQPDMVQIRVADPAAEPDAAATELRAYASERGISIRTHSDSMAMLSNATFQALAADYRINERFPTTEVPPEGYKIDLMRPRWVANYSVAIRNRGLVANRGYIVMASSDRVLDPNHVVRNDYED
ncbi:hypothetical protein LPJ77_005155 [Coemansia sp. RSA 2523]|nr:hypothetical protein LPJ58_004261 [Coemansia sp. RSA 1591]KAJ1790940.1 hypothetical protein LPJ62_001674 [Coemansia sp. RSA 2167]KAJ1803647.1 hypothetical protein LPJ77_005155 [Coemansia sp. RSA 2523]KAJ2556129.1 hypothetical protein IWW35_000175 [Coemansia sp. RSA 1878]KAJ2588880.1 hypothetical protein IWW49_002766 [Coemansia sp. RSA 1797]KAJ2832916.1 hypothetical protein J3B01_004643 [Coemansia erecta]